MWNIPNIIKLILALVFWLGAIFLTIDVISIVLIGSTLFPETISVGVVIAFLISWIIIIIWGNKTKDKRVAVKTADLIDDEIELIKQSEAPDEASKYNNEDDNA